MTFMCLRLHLVESIELLVESDVTTQSYLKQHLNLNLIS